MGNETGDGNLEYNNDPIIHKLFIQIINLITFFNKQMTVLTQQENEGGGMINFTQRKLKGIYQGVAIRLNNSGREVALFLCISMPNDDVKLSVVNCLYYVPIEQIDAEEID